MNKIFKLVWDKTTQRFIVVSELAKSKTKSSTTTDCRTEPSKLLAVGLAGAALLGSPQAMAAMVVEVAEANGAQVTSLGKLLYAATPEGTNLNYGDSVLMGKGANLETTAGGSVVIGNNATGGSISTVIGSKAKSLGEQDVVIGSGAEQRNTKPESYSTVIGRGAINEATGSSAVAIGYKVTTSGAYSVAIGSKSISSGNSATAIGYSAKSSGNSSFAMGFEANASGNLSTALGSKSIANATAAFAGGQQAQAYRDHSVAIGSVANSNGENGAISIGWTSGVFFGSESGVAVGAASKTNGVRAISIGRSAQVNGERSVVVGANSVIDGVGAYSAIVGTRNYVNSEDTYVLGSEVGLKIVQENGKSKVVYLPTVANSVYLGKDSIMVAGSVTSDTQSKNVDKEGVDGATTTAGAYGSVTQAAIRRNDGEEVRYSGFAGEASVGGVSVGAAGAERRIMNVAAGEISATSTDVVNGSQLYTALVEIGDMYFHVNDGTGNQEIGNPIKNNGKITERAGAYGTKAVTAGVEAKAIGKNSIAVGNNALSGFGRDKYTEVQTIETELLTKRTELKTKQQEIVTAKDEIRHLEREESRLTIQIANLVKEIAIRDENIRVATEAKVAAETANNAKEVTKQQNAINKNNTEKDEFNVQKREYETRKAAIPTEIGAKRTSITTLETELVTLKTEIKNKTAELNGKLTDTKADAIAIGNGAVASGEASISIGKGNIVSGNNSGAIGDPSLINGTGAYTLGNDNAVGSTSKNVGAFGNNNQIGATATYTDGKLQTASGLANEVAVENSRAVGNNNYITSSNTYMLGSGIGVKTDGSLFTSKTVENSVYLGNDSTIAKGAAVGTKNLTKEEVEGTTTTAGDTGKVKTATVNEITYGGFAGDTAKGAVTVGSAGEERRIMNVAAGEISKTSTDAINGSQLYLVTNYITENAPFQYVDAAGNPVVKIGDAYYPKGTVIDANGNPVDANGNTIAPIADQGSVVIKAKSTNPENVTNIKGNLTPTYNKGDFEIDTTTGAPKTDGATVSTPTTSMTSTTSPKAPTAVEVKAMYNNAATVGDVLNAGWNVQENGTAKDFVKPYDTVNFINGAGTTVKVETNDNGNVSSVQVNGLVAVTDKDGNVLIQIKEGDETKWYKAEDLVNGKPKNDAKPVDASDTQVNLINPSATTNTKGEATQLGNVKAGTETLSNPVDKDGNQLVKAKDGKYYPAGTELNEDGSVKFADAEPVETQPTANVSNAYTGLADLNGSTKTNALSVADAKKLGWVVSASGNDYADDVRNANRVDFVGKDGIKVTGETTAAGVREITISLEKGEVVKSNEKTITVAGEKKDVVEVVKVAENGEKTTSYYDKNDIDPTTGNPTDTANALTPDENTKVENKGANFVTGNAVADAIQKSGFIVGKLADSSEITFENQDEKVNPDDNVRFTDGKGTSVSLGTVKKLDSEGNVVTTTVVKFDIDTGSVAAQPDGSVKGPSNNEKSIEEIKTLNKALTDAQTELKTAQNALAAAKTEAEKTEAANKVKTAQAKVKEAEKAINDAGLNKVATAQEVANAINQSGFKLKTSETADGVNATAADTDTSKLRAEGELINPADTVTMIAGKNMTVKQEASGNITYATKDEVNFKTIEVGAAEPTYKDKDGNVLVKVGDVYYNKKAYDDAQATDGVKDLTGVNQVDVDKAKSDAPVKLAADTGVATTHTDKDGSVTNKDAPSALSVKDSLGENSQITGIASALNTKEVKTNNPIATTPAGSSTLVDLDNAPDNAAVTTGDLKNLGWVVSASGNNYTDTVKNANEVKFTGKNGVIVEGNTVDNVREISISFEVEKGNMSAEEGKLVDTATQTAQESLTQAEKDLANLKVDPNTTATALVEAAQKVIDAQKLLEDLKTKGEDVVNAETALAAAKEALKTLKADDNTTPEQLITAANDVISAEKALESAKNKVATVQNVVEAVNQSGWNAAVNKTGSGEFEDQGGDTLVNPGDTVTMIAGDNMKITKNGLSYTVETKKDVTFDNVTVNKAVNVGPVTITAKTATNSDGSKTNELSVGTENAPTRITNVAPGVKDTDAVNVSQLKGIQNNVNQKFGDVYNKLDRTDKDLRAGVAGATAMAFLQRPNEAGKSLVSVGVAGYRGQNAIAVGYARNSDSNKVSIKFGLGVNTRNDMTYGGSIGYQW